MSRVVERLTGIVTGNDGDLAECKVYDEEIYLEDMHIFREDVENPEDFLRNFAVGRELSVQRIVSLLA
jgi:hypothetical protein